ncbi:NADPH:quinone reductase-like Zn-dependent oxidoreductase [Saccharothrix carnea]|uniref:NADPH:quinone reductase-like Zn-dependent oxidoreductase n=2 Tax=Saccharothrix carnea TaxID=1280637 RepID=A0A2P8IBF1_SACCR|nr:NAD(P)-dependent alcohol dehydrogenase [Saccharothrix carnea]PSL55799.1 NADPH:quinone reductase-like Zn-dependent oxidoreductase [Saccharothrix carnea]
MKAITQDRYGSPDVLLLSEVDRPAPADDQVLVRVRAATVNARDWHVMRGDPYLARLMPGAMGLRGPRARIRGTDFAGVVEAVGARVTRFRPGDEVYGEADGAFAEYVCAPHDVVEHKPANLTFEQAAALPLAANTALMGLRDQGRVRPGQRVLVNGASGGVGTFAVQLGKWLGAEVTAVCGTRNVELVASLGADHVIDYNQDDFTRDTGRYDVVFDLVGNHSLTALRRTLKTGGTLVLSGGGVSTGGSLFGPLGLIVRAKLAAAFIRRHRVLVLDAWPDRENLATLAELAQAGTLVPVIDRTYGLGEVPDAIRYVEDEHARAKVVITV